MEDSFVFAEEEKRYTEFLLIRGLSPSTIEQYLRQFYKLEYLESVYNDSTPREIQKSFVYFNLTQHRCPIFRGMLKTYLECKSIDITLPKIMGRRHRKVRRETMSQAEVEAMTKEFLNYDVRYGIGFLLLYYCGLRRQELLNIRLKNFEWSTWNLNQDSNCRLLVHGKGNRERKVLVPPKVMLLTYYLITRFYKNMDAEDKVFPLSREKLRRKLNQFGLITIGREVNPHLLRHTRTTHLYDLTEDLLFLRDFLGHESVSTTQLYVHPSPQHSLAKLDTLMLKEDSSK